MINTLLASFAVASFVCLNLDLAKKTLDSESEIVVAWRPLFVCIPFAYSIWLVWAIQYLFTART